MQSIDGYLEQALRDRGLAAEKVARTRAVMDAFPDAAVQGDDLPLCEACDEPVPDDDTRVFCSEDGCYFHRACFGFDVEGAIERLRVIRAEYPELDAEIVAQAEAAIELVGLRDRHDMELLLAAIGVEVRGDAWYRVLGEPEGARQVEPDDQAALDREELDGPLHAADVARHGLLCSTMESSTAPACVSLATVRRHGRLFCAACAEGKGDG